MPHFLLERPVASVKESSRTLDGKQEAPRNPSRHPSIPLHASLRVGPPVQLPPACPVHLLFNLFSKSEASQTLLSKHPAAHYKLYFDVLLFGNNYSES